MALSSSRPRHLLRPLLRGFHATAQALERPEQHEFSNPSEYLGSWGEPAAAGDPREAWGAAAQGLRARRAAAAGAVHLRGAAAGGRAAAEGGGPRRAARLANEERKAAAAQTSAAERCAFEQDFRQALMKERGEKLESWREKEKLKADKKAKDRELLRRKISVWVAENQLEDIILRAIERTTPL